MTQYGNFTDETDIDTDSVGSMDFMASQLVMNKAERTSRVVEISSRKRLRALSTLRVKNGDEDIYDFNRDIRGRLSHVEKLTGYDISPIGVVVVADRSRNASSIEVVKKIEDSKINEVIGLEFRQGTVILRFQRRINAFTFTAERHDLVKSVIALVEQSQQHEIRVYPKDAQISMSGGGVISVSHVEAINAYEDIVTVRLMDRVNAHSICLDAEGLERLIGLLG